MKSFSPPRTDETTTTTMLWHIHCTHIPEHVSSRGKRVIFFILLRFLRRSVLGLCLLCCIGHSRLWWRSRGCVLGRWGRRRSIVGAELGVILPHRGCEVGRREGQGTWKVTYLFWHFTHNAHTYKHTTTTTTKARQGQIDLANMYVCTGVVYVE